MYRLTISETSYITFTEDEYKNLPIETIFDRDTNEFLFTAKVVNVAQKNMLIIADEKLFERTNKMRFRKGARGLYYEDGKLIYNDYNRFRLNPFEMYSFTLHNQGKYFIKVSLERIRDFLEVILELCMLPFLGFITYTYAYFDKKKLTDKELKEINKKFSKDYYEVLDK